MNLDIKSGSVHQLGEPGLTTTSSNLPAWSWGPGGLAGHRPMLDYKD